MYPLTFLVRALRLAPLHQNACILRSSSWLSALCITQLERILLPQLATETTYEVAIVTILQNASLPAAAMSTHQHASSATVAIAAAEAHLLRPHLAAVLLYLTHLLSPALCLSHPDFSALPNLMRSAQAPLLAPLTRAISGLCGFDAAAREAEESGVPLGQKLVRLHTLVALHFLQQARTLARRYVDMVHDIEPWMVLVNDAVEAGLDFHVRTIPDLEEVDTDTNTDVDMRRGRYVLTRYIYEIVKEEPVGEPVLQVDDGEGEGEEQREEKGEEQEAQGETQDKEEKEIQEEEKGEIQEEEKEKEKEQKEESGHMEMSTASLYSNISIDSDWSVIITPDHTSFDDHSDAIRDNAGHVQVLHEQEPNYRDYLGTTPPQPPEYFEDIPSNLQRDGAKDVAADEIAAGITGIELGAGKDDDDVLALASLPEAVD